MITLDLKKNIDFILSRIEKAVKSSQRNLSDVTLIAVSKKVPVELIEQAAALGLNVFGENRIEEAEQKVEQLPHLEWHLIGHLQSRKVKKALTLFQLIHSVDSIKLIEKIDQVAQNQEIEKVPVLLELNISGEESKYGFSEAQFWELLPLLEKYPHLQVQGLMTMAPFSEDQETSRPIFRRLKELQSEAVEKGFFGMNILSMGMSQDFEVAIEEGATHIRVGTRLFKGVDS